MNKGKYEKIELENGSVVELPKNSNVTRGKGFYLEFSNTESDGCKAVALENGMIVSILDKNLEFEDDIFYPVKKNGRDILGNVIWERTGGSFAAKEINGWF